MCIYADANGNTVIMSDRRHSTTAPTTTISTTSSSTENATIFSPTLLTNSTTDYQRDDVPISGLPTILTGAIVIFILAVAVIITVCIKHKQKQANRRRQSGCDVQPEVIYDEIGKETPVQNCLPLSVIKHKATRTNNIPTKTTSGGSTEPPTSKHHLTEPPFQNIYESIKHSDIDARPRKLTLPKRQLHFHSMDDLGRGMPNLYAVGAVEDSLALHPQWSPPPEYFSLENEESRVDELCAQCRNCGCRGINTNLWVNEHYNNTKPGNTDSRDAGFRFTEASPGGFTDKLPNNSGPDYTFTDIAINPESSHTKQTRRLKSVNTEITTPDHAGHQSDIHESKTNPLPYTLASGTLEDVVNSGDVVNSYGLLNPYAQTDLGSRSASRDLYLESETINQNPSTVAVANNLKSDQPKQNEYFVLENELDENSKQFRKLSTRQCSCARVSNDTDDYSRLCRFPVNDRTHNNGGKSINRLASVDQIIDMRNQSVEVKVVNLSDFDKDKIRNHSKLKQISATRPRIYSAPD